MLRLSSRPLWGLVALLAFSGCASREEALDTATSNSTLQTTATALLWQTAPYALSADKARIAYRSESGDLRIRNLGSGSENIVATGIHGAPQPTSDAGHFAYVVTTSSGTRELHIRDWATLTSDRRVVLPGEHPFSDVGNGWSVRMLDGGAVVVTTWSKSYTLLDRFSSVGVYYAAASGAPTQQLYLSHFENGALWSPADQALSPDGRTLLISEEQIEGPSPTGELVLGSVSWLTTIDLQKLQVHTAGVVDTHVLASSFDGSRVVGSEVSFERRAVSIDLSNGDKTTILRGARVVGLASADRLILQATPDLYSWQLSGIEAPRRLSHGSHGGIRTIALHEGHALYWASASSSPFDGVIAAYDVPLDGGPSNDVEPARVIAPFKSVLWDGHIDEGVLWGVGTDGTIHRREGKVAGVPGCMDPFFGPATASKPTLVWAAPKADTAATLCMLTADSVSATTITPFRAPETPTALGAPDLPPPPMPPAIVTRTTAGILVATHVEKGRYNLSLK